MLTKRTLGICGAVLLGGVVSSAVGCGDDETDGGGTGGAPGTTTTTSTTAPTTTKTTGAMTTTSTTTSSTSASTGNTGTTTGGTTTGGPPAATTAASTATGMMLCELPDTTQPSNCAEACSDLYDCGALTCDGMNVCPGFDGSAMQKAQFEQFCLMACAQQMALINLVDPANCDDTVATLSGVSAEFDDACQNGLP
jgi:hypothetical protein